MKEKTYLLIIFLFLGSTLFFFSKGSQRAPDRIHLNVERFKLNNGLTCLLVPRPKGAPVFAAYIRVKVGNIEETPGLSGLAHFFEHMAFKGPPLVGTTDYEKEKIILDQLGIVGEQIVEAKQQKKSPEEIIPLLEQLKGLQESEHTLLEKEDLVRIMMRVGGSDMNATTSNDFTSYFVSLPSNFLELWAYLESERLKNPVFREFYKERDVVAEERRMRNEISPAGRLYEAFMAESFESSPYRIPVVGYASEIEAYTFKKAKDFYERFYIPSRMVVALVGNFDVGQAKKLVEHYFGALPGKPDEVSAFPKEEFKRSYPHEKIIEGDSEPRLHLGFHRPNFESKDDVVFDVLEDLLCNGRTSRLYKALITDRKMAADIGCYSSMPGNRLDALFGIDAVPLKPFKNGDLLKTIMEEIDRLKKEPPTEKELEKIKTGIDAELIWALKPNMGAANLLTYFESLTGDWHYLDQLQDEIHKVQASDVMRVVNQYFVKERQVSVLMEKRENK